MLQHRYGCYVVPVYDYSAGDKAPKLQGAFRGYVVPDLDVSKDGRRSWVEVKAKTNAGSPTRITGQVEHGFSWRLFQQYRTVQQITGTPVFIIILEVLGSAMRCARRRHRRQSSLTRSACRARTSRSPSFMRGRHAAVSALPRGVSAACSHIRSSSRNSAGRCSSARGARACRSASCGGHRCRSSWCEAHRRRRSRSRPRPISHSASPMSWGGSFRRRVREPRAELDLPQEQAPMNYGADDGASG